MNVFVTGASGFVGEEILQQLSVAGHSIRILARHPQSQSIQALVQHYRVEVVPGDVLHPDSLNGCLTGMDAVIHLVGIISEVGENTFERVHVEGTRAMLNATAAAGISRYLQMSALGTRPHAIARYHQTKWAAEELVRASKLHWTIFRPSLIYGKRDHFVNMFAKLSCYSPVMPIIGRGNSLLQPVPVLNVAQAFVTALTQPKSVGQTYDLCGDERLSFEGVIDSILEVTQRQRLKLHLPLPVARAQAALLEFIFPLFGQAPPLNRDQIRMLQEDNIGNPKPANELFGLKTISFKQGISSFLKKS